MKNLKLAFLIILGFQPLFADHIAGRNISVIIEGQNYYCSTHPGVLPGMLDPDCYKNLTNWCNKNTSLNSGDCFSVSSNQCKYWGTTGYQSCVTDMTTWCDKNTSNNSGECFHSSLENCRGR